MLWWVDIVLQIKVRVIISPFQRLPESVSNNRHHCEKASSVSSAEVDIKHIYITGKCHEYREIMEEQHWRKWYGPALQSITLVNLIVATNPKKAPPSTFVSSPWHSARRAVQNSLSVITTMTLMVLRVWSSWAQALGLVRRRTNGVASPLLPLTGHLHVGLRRTTMAGIR